LPEFEPASIIHRENLYGRATGSAQPFNLRARKTKWSVTGRNEDETGPPPRPSRDQSPSGSDLYEDYIGGKQAPDADIIETAVLFRNDVLDVVLDATEQFTAPLMYLTLFRTVRHPVHGRVAAFRHPYYGESVTEAVRPECAWL
jgi:hypothetical protein